MTANTKTTVKDKSNTIMSFLTLRARKILKKVEERPIGFTEAMP